VGPDQDYLVTPSGGVDKLPLAEASSAPGSGGNLKSTPYWTANKWKRNPTPEVKKELIDQGWADATNWKERAKSGIPMQESKIQKHYFLKPIEDRNERLENLVFERLVKNATEIR
jgi:hypothetical protein